VGALTIKAKGLSANGKPVTRTDNGVDGVPKPPGIPN
jgi:hypothetical protein